MESNLDEFEQEPVKRPTLLTVLCILTFIGSGGSILSNIYAYSTAQKAVEVFQKNVKNGVDSSLKNDTVALNARHRKKNIFAENMVKSVSKMMTVDNIRKSSMGKVIASLFTLFGALLMWRLNRKGFYLYISGVLIGLVVPFYLYGGNLMAVGMASASGFFGLVFIALYALNLKTMR